ncbi:MAG: phage major capsid protein, partial [Gemmatimonadaceae bacterium]|nr:phage major capsid protein [Gemmatimonadaceae bacterium]
HVPARSKSRGIWIGNGDIEPQLDVLSIPAGTGALEPRFVTYDAQGTLRIKGRPFIPVEQCPTLGTVGDLIFFDPAEYILATKGDIDGQESMHVRFIYGEMTFRWTYYANGRPAWLSAVSAFKGSTSLSPYVTLATRA